jgi:hypothetical protein
MRNCVAKPKRWHNEHNSPRGVGIHDQGLVPLGEHDLELGPAHQRCRLDLLLGIGVSTIGCSLECGGRELVYSVGSYG